MIRIAQHMSKAILIGSALVFLWNHFIHRHVFFWKPFLASWPIVWSLAFVALFSVLFLLSAFILAVRRKEVLWPVLAIILCLLSIRSSVELIQRELPEINAPDRK